MAEDDKDYSTYVDYIETNSETYSVFAGFAFTAITVVLTLYPDLNEIPIQIILFFLAVFFNLIGFILHSNERLLAFCVRFAPELPAGYKSGIVGKLGNSVYYIFIGIVVAMFVAWGLIYLAIATAFVSGFFIVLGHVLSKPFAEHYKKYGWAKRSRVRD